MYRKGDYYRYMSEVNTGTEKEEFRKLSHAAYDTANDVCKSELPPTHPIRLGQALSFAVFNYEILNEKDRAYHTAKTAFDDAIGELNSLSEESYKDATLIMQLLKDNLQTWESERDIERKYSQSLK